MKFFSDYLYDSRYGGVSPEQRSVMEVARRQLQEIPNTPPQLTVVPLAGEETVYRALCEAGRKTVECHLVDSFFGNISCRYADTLYISQTGSSPDELEG